MFQLTADVDPPDGEVMRVLIIIIINHLKNKNDKRERRVLSVELFATSTKSTFHTLNLYLFRFII